MKLRCLVFTSRLTFDLVLEAVTKVVKTREGRRVGGDLPLMHGSTGGVSVGYGRAEWLLGKSPSPSLSAHLLHFVLVPLSLLDSGNRKDATRH